MVFISQGSPEKQKQQDVYIENEIYDKELVHMLRKAENSQDLQPTSWKHKRSQGVVQSNWEDLTTRCQTQRDNGPSSIPNAGRLQALDEPVLHFQSKVRKRQRPS